MADPINNSSRLVENSLNTLQNFCQSITKEKVKKVAGWVLVVLGILFLLVGAALYGGAAITSAGTYFTTGMGSLFSGLQLLDAVERKEKEGDKQSPVDFTTGSMGPITISLG